MWIITRQAQHFIWMRSSLNKSNRDGSQNKGKPPLLRGQFCFGLRSVPTKSMATGCRHFLLAACSFLFLFILSGCQPRQNIYIQKLKNQHYRLIVKGSTYIVKGVCYNPIPTGSNHEYDWWSDKAKPWLIDGKLMKAMGVNTIRLYQSHEDPQEVRQVIRDLYKLYGIRTLMGIG